MLLSNPEKSEVSVVDFFNNVAPDWFHLLGLMGIPLLICALLVVTISLERFVYYVKLSLKWTSYYETIAAHVICLKDHPKELRDEVASQILSEIQNSFFKGISLLRTISVISPLLGLLGTILGLFQLLKLLRSTPGLYPQHDRRWFMGSHADNGCGLNHCLACHYDSLCI